MEQASRYAEALMAPHLVSLCASLRTKECEVCGSSYVEDHNGGLAQRWCSDNCRWVGRGREKAQKGRDETQRRYDLWARRARKLAKAVGAMCRGCEPEGACRQADCPLRPVSPLPLVGDVSVPLATRGSVRHPADHPLRAVRLRESKAAWARAKRASA
jgi:hypothetical protein